MKVHTWDWSWQAMENLLSYFLLKEADSPCRNLSYTWTGKNSFVVENPQIYDNISLGNAMEANIIISIILRVGTKFALSLTSVWSIIKMYVKDDKMLQSETNPWTKTKAYSENIAAGKWTVQLMKGYGQTHQNFSHASVGQKRPLRKLATFPSSPTYETYKVIPVVAQIATTEIKDIH